MLSIAVISLDSSTVFKDVQLKNIAFPTIFPIDAPVVLSLKTTVSKFSQFINTSVPILTTLAGISTDSNDLHSEKALFPIAVKLFDKTMFFKSPLSHCFLIEFLSIVALPFALVELLSSIKTDFREEQSLKVSRSIIPIFVKSIFIIYFLLISIQCYYPTFSTFKAVLRMP